MSNTEQTTTTPTFDYDETVTTGATTFRDAQGSGGGSDNVEEYGDLDNVQADLKTPQQAKTKCIGFCSAPRVIDKRAESGALYVSVTFTACEPPELAGRKDDLFGPVEGGDSASRQRHLEALNKLAGKVGAQWDPTSLGATLKDMKSRLADAGSTVAYTLSKGKKGGTFVNV